MAEPYAKFNYTCDPVPPGHGTLSFDTLEAVGSVFENKLYSETTRISISEIRIGDRFLVEDTTQPYILEVIGRLRDLRLEEGVIFTVFVRKY